MTERLYCALPRFLLHSHCDPPPRTLSQSSPDRSPRGAGWSSRVARRAHNPNVAGSNPAPTTSQESRFDGAQPVKNEAQLGALNGRSKVRFDRHRIARDNWCAVARAAIASGYGNVGTLV